MDIAVVVVLSKIPGCETPDWTRSSVMELSRPLYHSTVLFGTWGMFLENDIRGLCLGGQIPCSENPCDCGTCFIVRSKGYGLGARFFFPFCLGCVTFSLFWLPQCVDPLSPPRHEVLVSAGHIRVSEPVCELEWCTRYGVYTFSVDSVRSVPTGDTGVPSKMKVMKRNEKKSKHVVLQTYVRTVYRNQNKQKKTKTKTRKRWALGF